MNKNRTYKKATFWERFAASIVDELILVILTAIISFIFSSFGVGGENQLFWILSILYGSLFIWKSGSTPGKKLLKLKVVSVNYHGVGLGSALFRESIGKLLSGLIFNLGYLWTLISSKRQTWHDKLAKTYVVKTDHVGKLIPIEEDEVVSTGQKILFAVLFFVFGLPVALIILFLIIYLFIAQPFQIVGVAMNPSFIEGQYYIANKLVYRDTPPQKSDVVVFKSVQNPDVDFIKRIIATPGDTIELRENEILINGSEIDETSYLGEEVVTYGGSFLSEGQSVTIPDGNYFIMGDNRQRSSDSREWGFVPEKNIIGKVSFCYYNCSLSKY